MVKSKYPAGLHFIVSTPAQTLDRQDRKAIRSHATRVGIARQETAQLRSWINPERALESLQKAVLQEATAQECILSVPGPRRVGTDFSGLRLPPGVEPYMIQDLVKLININKHGVYPYEICLDVHPVERGWFPYMISDVCCLHSMMFSVRAYAEMASHNQPSHLACLHYAQTLRLLQARLNESDQTAAISDATIMVVITLAAVAELTKDFEAVANHMKGLEKMVGLRGGVRALNTHNNIQVKVCRADLAYSLLSGHRPRLLKEEITWGCFLADHGLIHCSHQPHDANIRAFAEKFVDTRLHNALKDLHAFSCISNLAFQTTRQLSPATYNEMMISVLYRLTHLSFDSDPSQEVIRTGLLAFSSTIFMQRLYMEQPYEHLLNLYSNALFRMRNSTDIDLPVPIVLWMVMLSHVVAQKEYSPTDWRSVWLDETILCAGINSWLKANEILRSIAWVDFVHSRPGKQVFEAAMLRLEMAAQCDIQCASL